MASDELERIVASDCFPDRVQRAGAVTVWSLDGRPFEGQAFRDPDGGVHVRVPAALVVGTALTPVEAAASGDALAKLAGALGAAVGRAIDRLGVQLAEAQAYDAAVLEKVVERLVPTVVEKVVASVMERVIAERPPVVVRVTLPELRAVLQMPRLRRTITRDLLGQIDGITVEPEEG